MGNQFEVDTASLRAAGSQYRAQSEALSRALSHLKATLPGLSGMCGEDDQGHAFAARYGPQAAQVQGVIDQMVSGLSKVGAAFPTMADNYERADSASRVGKG